MTESEAKTKLCPMMLTNDRDTGHSLCEGSSCMAWRRTYQVEEWSNNGLTFTIQPGTGGYCGLAGKP